MNLLGFLFDPANWSGGDGIGQRLLEHLFYSGVSLLAAMVVAIPLGILIGHTRRGNVLVAGISNAARAIPTLGLLVLAVTLMSTGALPVVLCLAVLAVPPILNGTVSGFFNADSDAVLAAAAMGMTDGQVIRRVELPLALPLIVSGVRSASLQVIASATVAAMAAAGGLGRLVLDGQKRIGGYPEVFAGAVLVMALAIVLDIVLGVAAAVLRRRANPVHRDTDTDTDPNLTAEPARESNPDGKIEPAEAKG
ncbi:ABC transporter permease [Enemella evansiae]|uniref:Glycine/betaine ABC transporter permease n=1 Tax=Enemella evansiae TaxID=2016499 RepID=A0A255GPG6_9ACTN|nr:ABC transporter permease [Enemella evansiae]PFG68883.1 osmoprotectant transport system permease protein [Propionibacteriaceae bacterium ES.041]OYN97001.1 glycine/betaine ABC transporter permease [Enemella evansiae]OYO06157.1 glycine/betaine ABC transporter permease [Enemella evansiae]OYO17029.1 glycine/betaine ABC transporter permease [Enemella evansiae]OYO17709.1 glycine/betaine ABC transporter permease [Enemella evansiae]